MDERIEENELHPFLVALQRALQKSIDGLVRLPFMEWAYVRTRRQYERDIQTMFRLVGEDEVLAGPSQCELLELRKGRAGASRLTVRSSSKCQLRARQIASAFCSQRAR